MNNPTLAQLKYWKSLKGSKHSFETKQKMRFSHLGRKYKPMSELGKKNLSISHKGIHVNIGVPKRQETKDKISKTLTGRKQSKETIQKRINSNLGKHFISKSEEAKEKIRQATLRQYAEGRVKNVNTKPELAMKELLNSLGINYIFQQPLDRFVVDFLIPNKKLVIEVDGEYWHNYPFGREKDRIRDNILGSKGYVIKRYWAKHILNNMIWSDIRYTYDSLISLI